MHPRASVYFDENSSSTELVPASFRTKEPENFTFRDFEIEIFINDSVLIIVTEVIDLDRIFHLILNKLNIDYQFHQPPIA